MRFTEQRMFGYVKCVLLGRMHGSWMLLITERKLFCFLILSFCKFCFIFRITLHIWISSRVCQKSEKQTFVDRYRYWINKIAAYYNFEFNIWTCNLFLMFSAWYCALLRTKHHCIPPTYDDSISWKKGEKTLIFVSFWARFPTKARGGVVFSKKQPPSRPPQAYKHRVRYRADSLMPKSLFYTRAWYGNIIWGITIIQDTSSQNPTYRSSKKKRKKMPSFYF